MQLQGLDGTPAQSESSENEDADPSSSASVEESDVQGQDARDGIMGYIHGWINYCL